MDPRVDDEELERFLAARADQARGDDQELLEAVVGRISATRQAPVGWATSRLVPGQRRIGWVLSVAAALVIGIGIGLVGPELVRPGSTASTAPSAAATVPPASEPPPTATPVPGPVEADILTPADLAEGLASGRITAEQVVLLEGQLVEDPRCPAIEPVELCRYRLVAGVPDLVVASGYVSGQFEAPELSRVALEITRRVDEYGRRIARVISDTLVTDDGSDDPLSVATLVTLPEDVIPDAYEGFLVEGWLVGAADADCTDDPTSSDAYGCGDATWLTDDPEAAFAPAIRLQNDAYRAFAPDPTEAGPTASPRRGVWLVTRSITRVCSSPGTCEVDVDQWAVIRRVAAAPTGGSSEPPPAGLAITCEGLERDLCERLGPSAATNVADAVSVFVTYYSEACLRANVCLPPSLVGYPHRYMAAVTAADGSISGWGCNENALGPTCETIAVADVVPLAEVRFEGIDDVAQVYLLPMDGSWFRSGHSDPVQPLPVGAYRIAVAAREAVQFTSLEEFPFDGAMPPDWCALTLDAEAGVIYTVTITPAGGSCTVEAVDTGLRRPD